MKYFSNPTTLEELRTQYKKLAMKYHPDLGGTNEQMQEINAEYEDLLKTVGSKHTNINGETYTRPDYDWHTDKFREIIDAIIHFSCDIEVCGSWIWCRNAFEYKDQLKRLGFFWCNNKKAWAWTDMPIKSKHHYSMETIREIFGSETIKTRAEDEKKLLMS